MKIIGITKEDWIEQMDLKTQDEFLKLVDYIVVVNDSFTANEDPYYFVKGDYDKVLSLLKSLSVCKAYPQRTLFSVNFALMEIKEGMYPEDLRKEWARELQTRCLV